MSDSDDKKFIQRQPRVNYRVKLKIKLPGFPDFIEKFSKDISEGGMFIEMKDPKPPGSIIVFEFVEKEDSTIIKGEAIVKWSRQKDPENPEKKPGIGLQFTKLTSDSKDLIKRIIDINLTKKQDKAVEQKQETEDIGKLIEEAKAEDTEKLNGVKTKGFFREKIDAPPTKTKCPVGESVIGIDLGTTNSCVAFVKDGKPLVVKSRQGFSTIPSIVAYTGEGKMCIGQEAKPYFLTNPERTVYGSKRMLGRKYKSKIISEIKQNFRYKIKEGENGDVVVDMGGKDIPLPLISALILKELKNIAEDHLGKKVECAVITVPAHYSNRQRECVKEAGILAGLEVKRIVNEPTAAALAYGLDKGLMEKVLIYDLGGGTFDVTLMDISQNVFEVLATGGDSFLGGIDFDNRIFDYLIGKFQEQSGIYLQENTQAIQRVKEAAEAAKVELSTKSTTVVHIPFLADDNGKSQDLKVELSRITLEALTSDLVHKSMNIVKEVMKTKGIRPSDIDEVLLVGGQTRMPLVSKTLTSIFRMEPKKGVHPDEVVALGAALLADTFGKIDSVVLLDALSVPIGIGLPGGKFKEIIPGNSRIPFEKTYSFTTTKDNQTSLDIDIFQGQGPITEECEYLGSFVIDNIPQARMGESKIHLTFNLDSECILHLRATESLGGKTYEARMIIRETPDCIKEQLKKEEADK